MSKQKSSEYLTTLEKGLRVLTCFSREQPQMTLSDVARASDLSPAVARRCLLTLLELGYVGKTGADYMLRPKVLSLSTAFTESFDIDNPGEALDRSGEPVHVPRITGKISRRHPVSVDEVKYLRSLTDRAIKFTVPGPFATE